MLAYPLVRLSASSSCCCSTPDSTPAHTLLDHLTETCALVVSARPGASEQREVDWYPPPDCPQDRFAADPGGSRMSPVRGGRSSGTH